MFIRKKEGLNQKLTFDLVPLFLTLSQIFLNLGIRNNCFMPHNLAQSFPVFCYQQ